MGMSDLANISIEIDGQLEKMTPAKADCNVHLIMIINIFPNKLQLVIYIISHNHDKSHLIHHWTLFHIIQMDNKPLISSLFTYNPHL